jgi:hypothetical protein
MILKQIAPYVEGGDRRRVLWKSKPHSTWDYHFSGNILMERLGNEGYAATMTCRRNRLPAGVLRKYFHYEKTTPGDKYAKVARFIDPITAVKVQRKASASGDSTSTDDFFARVHVSIQSTSWTNFFTVQ